MNNIAVFIMRPISAKRVFYSECALRVRSKVYSLRSFSLAFCIAFDMSHMRSISAKRVRSTKNALLEYAHFSLSSI